MKTLLQIMLFVFLMPGCADSQSKNTAQATVQSPEIDLPTAVISGNLEAVKQHIEAGSNLDEKDAFSGSTPLITAATFDKAAIAKALIDAGADLTITNNDGGTALHAAAFFCRVEIVQILIDAKADKTVKNNYGATPRESVMGPYQDVKPIYEMLQQQLEPIGFQLNLAEVEKTRPVIAMMLQ